MSDKKKSRLAGVRSLAVFQPDYRFGRAAIG